MLDYKGSHLDLLCDEPTGALDYATGKLVLKVIQRINEELGTTTAVITEAAAWQAAFIQTRRVTGE